MQLKVSNQESLRTALKRDTQAIHDQLEQMLPLLAVQQGDCCMVSTEVIRIFNHWHKQVDHVLMTSLSNELFQQFRQDDLPVGLSIEVSCVKHASHTPTVSYGMGWLYVILGSSLGATSILKTLREVSHSSDCKLTAYYEYMAGKKNSWRDFLNTLSSMDDAKQLDKEQVIQGAHDGFNALMVLCKENPGQIV